MKVILNLIMFIVSAMVFAGAITLQPESVVGLLGDIIIPEGAYAHPFSDKIDGMNYYSNLLASEFDYQINTTLEEIEEGVDLTRLSNSNFKLDLVDDDFPGGQITVTSGQITEDTKLTQSPKSFDEPVDMSVGDFISILYADKNTYDAVSSIYVERIYLNNQWIVKEIYLTSNL